ncbi:hypothetical protein LWI29_012636 [Acer saccharum]|uniref:Uncharacterized protein n=1 Tax=Acer saccharum TaxID=4024 RepID=A0AA39W105_ACESA|nr:hypothetical protein LWI29_012636 [Acer saccharum]
MNGAKRSAEAVGCKNASVGERSALEGSTRTSGGGRSGSENVGLSNANIGENPMPRKPKGSSARFVHGGISLGSFFISDSSALTKPATTLFDPSSKHFKNPSKSAKTDKLLRRKKSGKNVTCIAGEKSSKSFDL